MSRVDVIPGDEVGSYAHPGETYTLIRFQEKDTAALVRSADGREFFLGRSLLKKL